MSTPTKDVLKLLLVAHPDDALEQLLGDDSTIAPRRYAQRVHDTAELEGVLGSDRWDLVLARSRVNGTSLSNALSTVQSTSPDLLVIAFEHTPAREEAVAALRLGARDLVDMAAQDHLPLLMQRELAALRERRAQQLLDAQHREFQRQTFALINPVSDAILILRARTVLHANPPALRLFGGGPRSRGREGRRALRQSHLRGAAGGRRHGRRRSAGGTAARGGRRAHLGGRRAIAGDHLHRRGTRGRDHAPRGRGAGDARAAGWRLSRPRAAAGCAR